MNPPSEAPIPSAPLDSQSHLGLADLERAVQAIEPAALLVLPRILRRVIKKHYRLGGFAYRVPHRKNCVIDREALLEIADRAELGVEPLQPLPEKVILLVRPDPEQLAAMTAGEALVQAWRLLFHARVHLVLEERISRGAIPAAGLRRRIRQIGATEFEEVHAVLQQEGFLLPPRDDASTYVEFAAVYLELRHFAESLLPRYFPGVEDFDALDELFAQDLDAYGLFAATRPAGSPDPEDRSSLNGTEEWPAEPEASDYEPLPPAKKPSEDRYRRFTRWAQRCASPGNVAGSAIYRARAARWAPPELAARAKAAVKTDISHLVDRLQAALDVRQRCSQAWQESLLALAGQTPREIWTPEARLLYDLQKVCVDHERDIYTVDLVEWVLSLFRRPIKRPLPMQRDVLMCKHLRSAAARLAGVRISESHRRQLAALMHQATQRIEERLRRQFRPLIVEVLEQVGLRPQNLPERVSREKLVEELLDQIVERGFLTMGDLRDALSRNHLKLPDLSPPGEPLEGASPLRTAWSGVRRLWNTAKEFVRGDPLLRANRRLAVALDGVYHRGEFYLRWMQRFSALGFGTPFGRFLTQYATVPFGGAYLLVAGVYYLTEDISGLFGDRVHLPIHNLPTILAVGVFLFGLIHVRWFRQGLWRSVKTSFRVARTVLVDPLTWFFNTLLIRQVLQSRLFRLVFRFLLLPLGITALAFWLVSLRATRWHTSAGTAASTFLAVNLLLNSRLGRNVEEMAADWLVYAWQRYGLRLLSGLFFLVIDLFQAFLENTERLLYTVDEWLRFRSGESRLSLVAKAVLGLAWFALTYLIRFAVNVLIEPQINPIKHFPVVTVSHKLLLALYYPFGRLLSAVLNIDLGAGIALATIIIWCIPGVFGFLAWELRANWRLYAANRSTRLRSVRVGSHGEPMGRLLKPGFHSGTIPKRYAKLRRAERKARAKGNWKAARKHLHALLHVELSIRHYVERELLALLAESKSWQAPLPSVNSVSLGTNCVRIDLESPTGRRLRITFEVQSGWLLAGTESDGWIEHLQEQQRQVLRAAMVGFFKSGGVELVRQQIEAELSPPVAACQMNAQGLVVWPEETFETEVRYELRSDASISLPVVYGAAHRSFHALDRSRLVFREQVIPWQRWVELWAEEQAGGIQQGDCLTPVPVLPDTRPRP